MSSVLGRPPIAPVSAQLHVLPAVRQVGRLLVAVANIVVLWAVHQLLDWGWPGFLTADVEVLLGLVTASLAVGTAVNLALALHPDEQLRRLGELVTAGLALTVGLRLLEVFPFDFAGYGADWAWLCRVALIAGIAAMGIAIVLNLIELLTEQEEQAGTCQRDT